MNRASVMMGARAPAVLVLFVAIATVAGVTAADGLAAPVTPSAPVGLRVALMGIGVEVHPGYVRVSEMLNLENTTREAFAGDVAFGVPPAARYIIFHEGLMRPRVDGEWIIDRLMVPPGPHRVSITYSIAGSGDLDLGRPVSLPIDRLVVLAAGPIRIHSTQLQALPTVVDAGRSIARAAGRAIAPGTLVLRVEGVPATRRWPAPAAAALLGIILAAGLVWAAARAASRPA